MRLTADTNVLVRAITEDDPVQSPLAQNLLAQAESVVVTQAVLCELVWVLSRGYRYPTNIIAEAVRRLANAANVDLDRPLIDSGLAMLDAGGDFADGVIAYDGRWRGAEVFVSFDKKAVTMLKARGEAVRLLA